MKKEYEQIEIKVITFTDDENITTDVIIESGEKNNSGRTEEDEA